jgi:hypothetical protein
MDCVNKVIPTRTMYEYNKAYVKANRDKVLERRREYRRNHAQEINNKASIPVNCGCGSTVRRGDKARHNRSEKHRTYMSEIGDMIEHYRALKERLSKLI